MNTDRLISNVVEHFNQPGHNNLAIVTVFEKTQAVRIANGLRQLGYKCFIDQMKSKHIPIYHVSVLNKDHQPKIFGVE